MQEVTMSKERRNMMKIKVKEQLEKKKMSRYRLQKITQWNYKRINAFYKGKVIEIRTEELEKLCEIFECKVEDLIEY